VWQNLRVAALLIVLAAVAAQAWFDRRATASWSAPLWVGIFPINADGSSVSARYLASLEPGTFEDIEGFFSREAHRYGVPLDEPLRLVIEPSAQGIPPALAPGSGALASVWWSLRLRYFAWRAVRAAPGVAPRIRVFVLFHDPGINPSVPHSLGLQKGLIGVVHAFAARDMAGQNSLVVAHELMHTLGATDKYDPQNDAPRFPEGYGEPERAPLYPQRLAEIMAGRRAITALESQMPPSLGEVVAGAATAREIGWLR
jgi:hypothetical protein